MDVSTGEIAGIKLAAFSKTRSQKNEQFDQLKGLDSTSCLVCRASKPAYVSYWEPKNDDKIRCGSDMRIWYFMCPHCLRRTSSLQLISIIVGELNRQSN